MNDTAAKPDWVAADWGTSNLRVWAMSASGKVLASRWSDAGMAGLTRDGFEPALLALIEDWLPQAGQLQVVACGMVGSRQGWVEARYRAVPCSIAPLGELTRAPATSSRIAVYVVPGIKQATPADVMRGEETQLAGLLAQQPNFDGVACLPGTHSKWVQISAGEVVSFCTFMTGELFALLSRQSVLRHSVTAVGWDDGAFDAGLADGLARPEALARRLFSLRAESLIAELSPIAARSRLSGLLIGVELAASRAYWLGQNLAIVGAPEMSRLYERALGHVGATAQITDAEHLTLAGLSVAYKTLMNQEDTTKCAS